MNLRRLARGQRCMVRLPGCTGGGEDTVLAHYRMASYAGTGLKPNDLCGAWACASCHDLVDQRKPSDEPRTFVRLAHAEACLRTIAVLAAEGLIGAK